MANSSEVINRGYLDNVIVTTNQGIQYNLGNPQSKLFKLRVLMYKIRRKING